MNKAEEITKVIIEDIRRSRVLIREAARAAVEIMEPYKVRIIDELIAAEMKLAKTLNDIITGDIKDIPKYGNKRGGAEHDG